MRYEISNSKCHCVSCSFVRPLICRTAMRIITATTSMRLTGSYTKELHMYPLRIEKHGKVLYLLRHGPTEKDIPSELAKKISKEDTEKGFARLALYKKCFEDTFLEVNTTNTLMIMPQELMQPRYRDEVPKYVDIRTIVYANFVNSLGTATSCRQFSRYSCSPSDSGSHHPKYIPACEQVLYSTNASNT